MWHRMKRTFALPPAGWIGRSRNSSKCESPPTPTQSLSFLLVRIAKSHAIASDALELELLNSIKWPVSEFSRTFYVFVARTYTAFVAFNRMRATIVATAIHDDAMSEANGEEYTNWPFGHLHNLVDASMLFVAPITCLLRRTQYMFVWQIYHIRTDSDMSRMKSRHKQFNSAEKWVVRFAIIVGNNQQWIVHSRMSRHYFGGPFETESTVDSRTPASVVRIGY